MEKINIEKIRGQWEEFGDDDVTVAGGDDTLESIKMVAEKVNEIIEFINT